MRGLTKKGYPCFVLQSNNINTTNDRCWGGSSTGRPKRKEREKYKSNKCPQRPIIENKDDSQPLPPPKNSTMLLAPWNTAYQATPSRRNATTTTLLPGHVLGFPRYAMGHGGRGISDVLQEGTSAPKGVTASLPDKLTRISPNRQPTTTTDDPSHSIILVVHQYAPPRSCSHHGRLTVASEARPTGSRGSSRKWGAAGIAGTREGTTSTTLDANRPDTT